MPSLSNAAGGNNGVLTGFALTGTTSNFVPGIATANSSAISDLLCPGTTYTFGSQVISAPGNYYEVYPGTGGCDSIAEVALSTVSFNTTISQSGPWLNSLQAGAVYQWINCTNGNAIIPGATSQSYTATANGQYAVILTLGGCSDTTICATVTGVGLNDLSSANISASPNPFNDNFTLSLPGNFSGKQVIVYDVTGRQVFNTVCTEQQLTISTSLWNASVYFVAIEGVATRLKLVKQ